MSSCKQTMSQYERARGAECSERISQLALPNLHVVSSVLRDHFRTLRKEQIQRLENLIKQIQESHLPSVSQLCLMNSLNKYKHCNQKRIKDVLDGIDTRKNTPQIEVELNQAKLLPIKSSSDSFLIGLSKQISFSNHNKNDKSAIDLSASLSPFKGVSRRAFSSINWNFRETVLIQVEGFSKTEVEQNSKSIQTDTTKTEVDDECAQDISVLYVQKNNHQKKSKLRQLHTLLESNGIVKNKTDCECQTVKCNKSDRSLMKMVELNDDVKITINHLCSLYVLVITYLNLLLNALQVLSLFLQARLCELKPYIEEIPNVLYDFFLDCKTQIIQLSLGAYDKLLQTFYPKTSDQLVKRVNSEVHSKKKKRKQYYTETFYFPNIKSILH